MRAITVDMAAAFWAGRARCQSNSEVRVAGNGEVTFYLHGNAIARRPYGMDRLEISAAGWQTDTTKERLNGILACVHGYVSQKDFVWYLYRKAADGIPFSEEMDTARGWWTLAHPGSDLEQIAMVTKEPGWNEGRV